MGHHPALHGPYRRLEEPLVTSMRDLNDLLASPDGRSFLDSQDIFVDKDEFLARLRDPVHPSLTEIYGAKQPRPVYALQQIYLDCTQSMLDRMALLDQLDGTGDCFPFFLWIDTDLAGTDALMQRFFWPVFGKKASVRVSAGANAQLELRFVPVETSTIEQGLDKLNTYLSQSFTGRKKLTRARARERYEQLRSVFLQHEGGVLSQLNHDVTYFLLNRYADMDPYSVLVSDLLDREVITGEVNLYLNNIDDVIRVFNEAVDHLHSRNIDPKVKPLAEDYLPLNYTCPGCRRRLRLHRQVEGPDTFAVAGCKCGNRSRFHLGAGRLSIDEIVEAGPWSPDVSLTLFMNDYVSGYVGGTSSGIYYGLVMKEVLEKVLQKRRVPILLPQPAPATDDPAPFDSLLYRYLTNSTGEQHGRTPGRVGVCTPSR